MSTKLFNQYIDKTLKPLLSSMLAVIIILNPVIGLASSIAQGFTTADKDLTVGMAASLGDNSNSSTQTVVRATTSNKAKFVGIITTKDANLLTLTNNVATVVVATSGEANAFVTDVNGVVKKGDNLSVSPIKGLLMKAEDNAVSVIGAALEDASSKTSTKQTIDSVGGKKRDISVTNLRIEISPHNIAGGDSKNKSFLRVIGENLAGRQISDWQAIIALVVFLLLLVVEGSLIYGSVHSTITALGRNPMAHDSIYRQLAQVILAVLAVLAFGIATIYAVLQI